jgi:hypothetical protein
VLVSKTSGLCASWVRIPSAAPQSEPVASCSFNHFLRKKRLAEIIVENKLLLVRYLELRFNSRTHVIREPIRTLDCSRGG